MRNYHIFDKVSKEIRILVVEDSEVMNLMLTKKLSKLGYECTSVFRIKEAMKLISENLYDYITLDLNFPDGKGIELIKKISDLSKTKIIVLTASMDENIRNNLFHYGILDYLSKENELIDNINDIDKTIKQSEKNKLSSILIVDDSLLIRTMIVDILKPRNYIIYSAKNYMDAYELLKIKPIDLVLLDLELPDIHGLKLLKTIKDEINIELPILIISGNNDSSVYRNCLKKGASDFIKKPFISEELILKVDLWIEFNRTNKELKCSNKLLEQYKNTVDISAIVSKTDVDGNIIYVNDQFEKMSGYKRSELIGKTHSMIHHPEMPKLTFESMWKTIRIDKKPWFGQVQNRKKNGEVYHVNTVVNPILDHEGNVIEYIAIRNDISDIEKTKEYFKSQYSITSNKFTEVMYLSKLYEDAITTSNIILRVGLDHSITYANDTFYKVTGYNKEELIDKSFYHILSPDVEKNENKNMVNSLKLGEKWKGKLTIISKFKKKCYFVTTVMPIKNRDKQILEYMFIIQDITEMLTLSEELEETQREIIYRMGEIGETRSNETGSHVKRVALYSKLLALKFGLNEKEATILKNASPMHDIGKVGIPDNILNKAGKLSTSEFEIMKSHAERGYDILKSSNRPVLQASAIVAREHHEKYDGNGYPRGLKGEDIHIFGRITALCDVFDALGSDRCYKKAWKLEKIIDEFKIQKGLHFDPKLVDLFLGNLGEFLKIRDRYV